MKGRDGKIVTFYSYKGGTGRTMALANVAFILAGSGKRVLAVDWDLESPGLHRFFHPFLDQVVVDDTPGVIDLIRRFKWEAAAQEDPPTDHWYREQADVSQYTISLNWSFPDGGALHFMSTGRQNEDYSASLASVNWDEFYARFGGGQFFDALRATLREEYDYVLIDSRTGLSDVAQICTLHMPDILVALFTLSDQGIAGVGHVTRQVLERYGIQRPIRILPVPTRIDEAEKEKAETGRAYARDHLAGLPQDMNDAERARYWGDVEIPYRAFYAYEETLATFGDSAEAVHTSMRAAFERLARQITEDQTVAAPAVDEARRQRVARAFTRRRTPHPGDFALCYVSEDRLWAEWVADQLERRGVQATAYDVEHLLARPDAGPTLARNRTLAVVSPAFARSRTATSFARQIADTDPSRNLGQLTAVYIAEMRPPESFAGRPSVNLAGLGEREAVNALLGCLDLPGGEVTGGPRFPGLPPSISNVGPRNTNFTGRNSALDKLRKQLTAKGAAVVLPVALHGLGGVGKTQVALEYAHRFKADYDVVWWIDAEVPDFINESLAELAKKFGIKVPDSLPDAAREALEMLRLGHPPYNRWLLVYDNASDPDNLRNYIPDGPGHVLITSRHQSWPDVAEALEVDVFTREESIEHLTKRQPSLAAEDADRLAERLGNLPIAVEVAAAWLAETGTPIAEYLEELETSSTALLSINRPAGYSHTLEATWQLSLDRLAERNQAGVRLLELCAFMSPSISQDLIHSARMREALAPFDANLRVPGILGRVIQEISRLALAKLDLQRGEIQIHRLMQDFLRNRLTAEEREERCHVVHRVLADASPRGDTDDPENWPEYVKIWPHLEPSQAAECAEHPVRDLLIEWVRFLWKRSQYAQALALCERLNTHWSQVLDPESEQTIVPDFDRLELQRQLYFLRFHMGNVHRSQGDFQTAHDVDENVLAAQRALLGEDDLHTLITAAGLAADLRGLGRYREALDMDRATHRRLKELFGDYHERTLLVASNLAVSLRLNGLSREARDLDEDTLERRRQVLGPKHPYTLQSQLALARDYRELGDFRQSLGLLEAAHRDYEEKLGKDFVDTLRTATALAVSLRYLGEHESARKLTVKTAESFAANYLPDHPDALACKINLAADLAATEGPARALAVSREALAAYENQLGPSHPYTCVARNNFGSYLLRTGNVSAALEQLQAANNSLMEALGAESPFTQGTGINLANVYSAAGRHEDAFELDRILLGQLIEHAGPDHPVTLTCSINRALDLEAIGLEDQARSLREEILPRLVELLGADHPTVAAARDGLRLDRELVPQPI